MIRRVQVPVQPSVMLVDSLCGSFAAWSICRVFHWNHFFSFLTYYFTSYFNETVWRLMYIGYNPGQSPRARFCFEWGVEVRTLEMDWKLECVAEMETAHISSITRLNNSNCQTIIVLCLIYSIRANECQFANAAFETRTSVVSIMWSYKYWFSHCPEWVTNITVIQ